MMNGFRFPRFLSTTYGWQFITPDIFHISVRLDSYFHIFCCTYKSLLGFGCLYQVSNSICHWLKEESRQEVVGRHLQELGLDQNRQSTFVLSMGGEANNIDWCCLKALGSIVGCYTETWVNRERRRHGQHLPAARIVNLLRQDVSKKKGEVKIPSFRLVSPEGKSLLWERKLFNGLNLIRNLTSAKVAAYTNQEST